MSTPDSKTQQPGSSAARLRELTLRGCEAARAAAAAATQGIAGGPAGLLDAVRERLGEAAAAVDARAPEADALCNMVKVYASEEVFKVAQHAMELHGGNGVMLDFGVEKILRDAAIFLHMDATADISRLKVVKSLFPATAGAYAGPE